MSIISIHPKDNEWQPIDEAIYAGKILSAIICYREVIHCDLGTAIFAIHDRLDMLNTVPKHFIVDIETYWQVFYS